MRTIPNLSHPAAPVGVDDKANLELFRGKTPLPQFDFKPLDHVELAEKLDLIDFEGGARVAGHGFYFLKNDVVLLELALQRYALDVLLKEGFTPMTTPDLARNEVLQGIGFIPRGPETQIYSIEGSDLSLVATAEITLGGLFSGQTIDAEDLPLKLCGLSHCFRTEAGAAGQASRGLYRVHQFTKVEMFAYTLPSESDDMLEYLRDMECRIFDGLGVPYRVVDTATGDLGGPGLSQVRPRGLDARPRRVRRGHQHVELHRLPVAAAEHPLSRQGRKRDAVRPHPQRHRHRHQPRPDRRDGELPAGRRLDRRARGPAGVDGQGADRGEERVSPRMCHA